MYTPPFTVSAQAINMIAEISAQMERFAIRMEQSDGLPHYDEAESTLDRQFGVKFGIKFGDNDKQ